MSVRTGRLENAPTHLRQVERIVPSDEDIHLQHGFEVNDVEAAVRDSSGLNGFEVSVKGRLEQADERLGVVRTNGRHEICVRGGAVNAMHGTGHRATEKIRDAQRVEGPHHQQVDLGLLGIHQSVSIGP